MSESYIQRTGSTDAAAGVIPTVVEAPKNEVATAIGTVSIAATPHQSLSPQNGIRSDQNSLITVSDAAGRAEVSADKEDGPSIEADQLLASQAPSIHVVSKPQANWARRTVARLLANSPVVGHILVATPILGDLLESCIKPVTQNFGRPDRAFVATMKSRGPDGQIDMQALRDHPAGPTNKAGTHYQETQGLNARCAEHSANAMMGGRFLTRADINAAYDDYNTKYPGALQESEGKQGSRMKGYLRRTAQIALNRKRVKTVGDDLMLGKSKNQSAHDKLKIEEKRKDIDAMIQRNDPDRMMIGIRKRGNWFKNMLGIDSMHWVALRKNPSTGAWALVDSKKKTIDAAKGFQPQIDGTPSELIEGLSKQEDCLGISVIMPHSNKMASEGIHTSYTRGIHDHYLDQQMDYDGWLAQKAPFRDAMQRVNSIIRHGVPADINEDARHIHALRAAADEMEAEFADMNRVAAVRDLATALEASCAAASEQSAQQQAAGGGDILSSTTWRAGSQLIDQAANAINKEDLWNVTVADKDNRDNLEAMHQDKLDALVDTLADARQEIRDHGKLQDPRLVHRIKTQADDVLEGWNKYGLPVAAKMNGDGRDFVDNLMKIQAWSTELARLAPEDPEDGVAQALRSSDQGNVAPSGTKVPSNTGDAGAPLAMARQDAVTAMRELATELDPAVFTAIRDNDQGDLDKLNISQSDLQGLARDVETAAEQLQNGTSITDRALRDRIDQQVNGMVSENWQGDQPPSEAELNSAEAKLLLGQLETLRSAIAVL
ncbi:MAG: hypothetical protein AAF416_11410 [Pseudomonadota bacterium]